MILQFIKDLAPLLLLWLIAIIGINLAFAARTQKAITEVTGCKPAILEVAGWSKIEEVLRISEYARRGCGG